MIAKKAEEDMLNNKQFEEKIINRREIYSRKIINVVADGIRLPDGGTSERELISHPGGVEIVAFDEQNHLLPVKQFRKPPRKVILEIPARKIDPGEEQNPEMAAARELEEETGYCSKSLSHPTSMYLSPDFVDEVLHIYRTQEVEKVENPLTQDESEILELHHLTSEEAQQTMKGQLTCDAKTIYTIRYWKLLTGGKQKDRLTVKGPFITRSELRKRQQTQANESLKKQRRAETACQQEEKRVTGFYREESKENKPVTKIRISEREKTTKWGSFPMKSLVIVILALCVVFLATTFIQKEGIKKIKVGIIGAVEKGIKISRENLGEPLSQERTSTSSISGSLDNHEVIIARSGIGKVLVSIITSLLIQ